MQAFEKGYYVNEKGDVISPLGRVRKPQPYRNSRGSGGFYYRFTVQVEIDGEKYKTSVAYHQLAAYQKFGEEALSEGVVVRHRNGDSEDNRPDNILLGTSSDNMMDQPEEVRKARALYAATFQQKLSDQQVRDLRAAKKRGATLQQICWKYQIAKSTASYIINRKTYAHVD